MTKKEKDGGWRLTPKSCLSIALNETSISDVDLFVEDDRHRKFESAYIILEQRMNNAGYITDKEGKTKYTKDSEKPEVIFSRTLMGFYPHATNEQVDAAWELFLYHMERQGNARKMKKEGELAPKED